MIYLLQNGLITVFKTFKIVTYFVETPLSTGCERQVESHQIVCINKSSDFLKFKIYQFLSRSFRKK